ncbi:TerB family tellurite resistance protein [Streptomyces physcomitrii]|uniref:TerB family tellurite resistance protein n=1 Tax=Streptomyces physcomitrii TaxID=2724184 RepID=A0ABX1H5D7_9ACTN|nr:TerB family tellurite resistance protein [Streptomyces physcomitrii]NKI42464.1 TerB family tellurite resistance protein [Streptomyces physcomitrii]
MLPGRGRAPAELISRLVGTHTVWNTVGDGEFFCPGCGGDRNYQRRTGRRFIAVLGIPTLPRGRSGPVIECAACMEQFRTEVLDHPTTHRLTAMLRDAVHTVTLSTLAAGGTSTPALEAAVRALNDAGVENCTALQLTALVEALTAETGAMSRGCDDGCASLSVELHEALAPLTPFLAAPGRESILLEGARIALADGPYTPAERDVLGAVGKSLTITTDEVERLLTAARTPS